MGVWALGPAISLRLNFPRFKRLSGKIRDMREDRQESIDRTGASSVETGVLVVLCSCPDVGTAEKLAAGLVEHRFSACVSIAPPVRSVYRWQGKIHTDDEALMIAKTSGRSLAGLESWLNDHHPYELPEIIALPVRAGLSAYLDWVVQETGQDEHEPLHEHEE